MPQSLQPSRLILTLKFEVKRSALYKQGQYGFGTDEDGVFFPRKKR